MIVNLIAAMLAGMAAVVLLQRGQWGWALVMGVLIGMNLWLFIRW